MVAQHIHCTWTYLCTSVIESRWGCTRTSTDFKNYNLHCIVFLNLVKNANDLITVQHIVQALALIVKHTEMQLTYVFVL